MVAATWRVVLWRQGMPRQEIRAVLAANDPLLVRRLLELHRERLGEWLEEQQGLVASIERALAGEPGPLCGPKTCRSSQLDRASAARPLLPRMGTWEAGSQA
jgi:hypothetical protein